MELTLREDVPLEEADALPFAVRRFPKWEKTLDAFRQSGQLRPAPLLQLLRRIDVREVNIIVLDVFIDHFRG